MAPNGRSASDWFALAGQCYIEGHQACAWCGGAHRVYKSETVAGVEYHCSQCDFRVGYDNDLDRILLIPGDSSAGRRAPRTMHA